MNTTELKKLAEAATPGPWKASDRSHIYTADLRLLAVAQHCRQTAENAAYIAAANPAAILKLLAINVELVEALKTISAIKFSNWSDGEMRVVARAALAKAEGGEL